MSLMLNEIEISIENPIDFSARSISSDINIKLLQVNNDDLRRRHADN